MYFFIKQGVEFTFSIDDFNSKIKIFINVIDNLIKIW